MTGGDEDHPLGREPIITDWGGVELAVDPNISGWPRRPLHERIQEYIDEVNPQTAERRGPWSPGLSVSTPGVAGDKPACRITDFSMSLEPDFQQLEELPGPCIMCGEDQVHVTVERNPDGDIEETELMCEKCGWRVTGSPVDADRLNRVKHNR